MNSDWVSKCSPITLDVKQKRIKDVTKTAIISHRNLTGLYPAFRLDSQATGKIQIHDPGLTSKEVRKQRKALIKLQLKARRKKDSFYEIKMKKMIKKVSTIIYHHILHSHKYHPKASEGAMLFSEKLLKQK